MRDLLLEQTECETAEEVVEMLMATYGQELIYLVFSYVKKKEVAEDLTQEIFIKCYKSIHTYKGNSAIKTWLWRIAINHCKDYLKSWYHRNVEMNLPETENATSQNETIEQEIMKKEEQELLSKAVLNLPVKYRELIYLFYFEEQSIGEMANILNKNENTIKTRLRKARELLKKEWEVIENG